jgi:hypothetical protein
VLAVLAKCFYLVVAEVERGLWAAVVALVVTLIQLLVFYLLEHSL